MYKWTTLSCPWNTNLRPSRFISFCIGTFSTLGGLYCYTHAFRNVFTMQHWNARHNFEYKCKYNKQVKCILLGGGAVSVVGSNRLCLFVAMTTIALRLESRAFISRDDRLTHRYKFLYKKMQEANLPVLLTWSAKTVSHVTGTFLVCLCV